MQIADKIALVQEWGFEPHDSGFYFNQIDSDLGILELWNKNEPDVIKFFRGSDWSHTYKIDWSLYN